MQHIDLDALINELQRLRTSAIVGRYSTVIDDPSSGDYLCVLECEADDRTGTVSIHVAPASSLGLT